MFDKTTFRLGQGLRWGILRLKDVLGYFRKAPESLFKEPQQRRPAIELYSQNFRPWFEAHYHAKLQDNMFYPFTRVCIDMIDMKKVTQKISLCAL